MKTRITRLMFIAAVLAGLSLNSSASAQERFSLSGVLSLDFSKTRDRALLLQPPGTESLNRTRDLGFGLDLTATTYLIDPRFLKLSFGASILRNRGRLDELQTRYGITGRSVYADLLPTSPYPFRFHYVDESSDYVQRTTSSVASGRKSLGFDWSLRIPKKPRVNISFDNTAYDYSFTHATLATSRARTFSVSSNGTFHGWELNSSFDDGSTTDRRVLLTSAQHLLRLGATKQVTPKSSLYVNSFYQKLDFNGELLRMNQRFSFFDLHSEFSTNHTEKLSTRVIYQFYRSAGDENPLIATPASAPLLNASTEFNSLEGLVSYRLRPEISVGAISTVRFTSAPDRATEIATRFLDTSATIGWNKRFGFIDTRAGFTQGIENASSNQDRSRRTDFRSVNAGTSIGNRRRLLVSADFNDSRRPDIFQAGGFFSNRQLSASIETDSLRVFRLSASAGRNRLRYLTTSGREKQDRLSYSASLDHKYFTLMYTRNESEGLRDTFTIPVPLEPNRVFRTLPIHALIDNPLLNTTSLTSYALARIRPMRNLDLEGRYYNDKAFFVISNNIFVKQLDVVLTYKLGKFTVYAGAMSYKQATDELLARNRVLYYVRIARAFRFF